MSSAEIQELRDELARLQAQTEAQQQQMRKVLRTSSACNRYLGIAEACARALQLLPEPPAIVAPAHVEDLERLTSARQQLALMRHNARREATKYERQLKEMHAGGNGAAGT